MMSEAIPLALVASIYPVGIAALLVFLNAPRPKLTSAVFLAGAAACLLTVGALIVVVLRKSGLDQSGQATARYGLQLGVGILLVVVALVVSRRPRRPPGTPSRLTSMADNTGLLAVFLIGVLLYTPSPSYLTALQILGTSSASATATAAALLGVVAIVLITIELPLLFYVFAPAWTVPKLTGMNAWLDVHGRDVLVGVLGVLGIAEIVQGLIGLL
jgi:hypothetical protein